MSKSLAGQGIPVKRNVNEQVYKARATHLMQAFLNTCSEFYTEETKVITLRLLKISTMFCS